MLDFANTRAVGAWACRNEGRKAQFCETEHLCARFRKHEGSRCVGESKKARFCETEHPCAQFRKHEGGGCMGESKELGFQNRAPMCSISQTLWQNQGQRVLGPPERRAGRVEDAEIRTGGLGFGKLIQLRLDGWGCSRRPQLLCWHGIEWLPRWGCHLVIVVVLHVVGGSVMDG